LKTSAEIAAFVSDAAHRAGFDLAGIAPATQFPEHACFPPWIAAGRAGEMHYLEARGEDGRFKREALAQIAPWARSVIVCAMNYHTSPASDAAPDDSSRGWISRYAWSQRDYHDVLMDSLRQMESALHEFAGKPLETRCYVDTGPLLERVFARYAGVGWIGKNTCIINQQLGSWLFLGVILTSLELPPALPAPDRCGSCRRCIDACPTNALVAPYELDARRCISYLTIEKRGEVPEELRAGMGRQVFGCDLCQDVCPWNGQAPVTAAPELQARPKLVAPELEWLATITEDDFRDIFRGSPIKRAKRSGLRRNAIVALGNSNQVHFENCLVALSNDPDPSAASHARWALRRLRTACPGAAAKQPADPPEEP